MRRRLLHHSTSLVCNVCSQTFQSRHELNLHVKCHLEQASLEAEKELQIKEEAYECEECDNVYLASAWLEKHISQNHNLSCECGKKFKKKSSLREHKARIHDPRYTLCQICGKSVKAVYLQSHINQHSSIKPFACNTCGKTFRMRKLLKQHAASHNRFRTRKYKCYDCDKTYVSHVALAGHKKRMHTEGSQEYSCDGCQLTFRSKYTLKGHFNRVHFGIKSKSRSVLCPVCGKSVTQLKAHMITHSAETPFICELCAKPFKAKRELTRHIDRHNRRNKPPAYVCKVCGKGFISSKSLETHQLRHSQQPQFECGQCGKKYYTVQAVTQHMESHTEKQMFRCTRCDKQFRRNIGLKNHVARVHDGIIKDTRYVTCEVCQQSIKDYYLKRHMVWHSDARPFECETCGKAFKTKKSLKRHSTIHEKKK